MVKMLMTTILMIFTTPLVAQGNTDGAAVDPTGQGGASAPAPASFSEGVAGSTHSQFSAQRANELRGCENIERQQALYCSQNPHMRAAQEATGLRRFLGSEQGAAQAVNGGLDNGRASRMSLAEVRAACEAATSRCEQECSDEGERHYQQGNDLARDPSAQAQAQEQYRLGDEDGQRIQQCRDEQAKTQAAVASLDMQLGEILAGLAALAQALGLGERDGVGTAATNEDLDEDEDKCDGEFADLLIECVGQSDPSGTRAGLASAGLNGNPAGQGITLNGDGSQAGTPGGTSGDDGGAGNNPFGGAGFGGAMGGGMPLGAGGGGAGSGSGGTGDDGPNTDIHKGYMGSGGGGGGGGGFSGGGGGGAAPRKFGNFQNGGNSNADKKALQRKLSKYAKAAGGRAPASTGGTNGPFDNIWGVVNKAYKKNSSSMYHQR